MGLDVLFVYGTLKRGGRYSALVSAHRRAEPALARGRLYALREGYPALIEAEEGEVHGEALFFEDLAAHLPALDELEGFNPGHPDGSLFLRVTRPIRLERNRRPLEAFMYVMPKSREPELAQRGARLLSDGIWTHGQALFEGPAADRLDEDWETP